MTVTAYSTALGSIKTKQRDLSIISHNRLFCPDTKAAEQMEELIAQTKKDGNTLGGIVEISVQNCPAGLGEPVFDKLDAALAEALMSIGAVKGVEIGAGFEAASWPGFPTVMN